MNRFHKDRPDPCSLCSINIRKQLISYKDRPVKIDSDHLAGFFIIFHSRFMGIFYKIPLYCFGKGSTRGFWLLDTKQYRNPRVLSFSNSFFARSSAGAPWGTMVYRYQRAALCILLCKLLIIDPIRRIQIFIRKKHLNIYSTSVLSYRSQRGIYSASGRTFLYAGRMILSTLISSSIRCALQPTIRAIANIGV